MNRSTSPRSTRAAVAATALATAALSFASAARADAPAVAAASAPVAATCTVGHRTVSTFAYSTSFADGLTVAYSDRDARPIASVDVRVEYDGRSAVVTDAFPLSGSANVTRSYKTIDGYAYSGRTARCDVAGVKFADGTAWSPESVAAR